MPTKPRTPRKTAAKPKTSVLQLDRQENVDTIAAMVADREPLFAVGGVEYTIPKQAPAAWTIKATHLAMTAGDLVASEWAIGKMLGEDGYKALADCETLTLTDFEIVRDAILGRVLPGDGSGPKS
jgi:hypothetical protein